jgi:hypothetical protein
MAVEVQECDRCGREPAHTWIITGPGGSPREIDLCDQHGAAVANAYALARPVRKPPPRSVAKSRMVRRPATAPPPPPEPEPQWR